MNNKITIYVVVNIEGYCLCAFDNEKDAIDYVEKEKRNSSDYIIDRVTLFFSETKENAHIHS